MRRHATLSATTLMLALLLVAGCSENGYVDSGGGETGGTGSSPEAASGSTEGSTEGRIGGTTGGSAGTTPETTRETGTMGEALVRQISSGSDGLNRRQVMISRSAGAISEATGLRVPDAGEGTYLAVFWGEKPTGGYTVEVLSARPEGSRMVVRLALEEPPPDAMVSQALTYPYATAILRGVDAGEKEFVFVAKDGQELGWPVRNA